MTYGLYWDPEKSASNSTDQMGRPTFLERKEDLK
jgi:hypothetical protein